MPRRSDPAVAPSPTGRRAFLADSGTLLGGAWLTLNLPVLEKLSAQARVAAAEGKAFVVLSPREAAVVEAASARIIPSDGTPGAREAGVVHFVDAALQEGVFAGMREAVAGVVAVLDGMAGGDGGYAALPEDGQDRTLTALEKEEPGLFGLLRLLTVVGTFVDPSYGGNQGEVGWTLLGFQRSGGWQPPFGHYDRAYREAGGGR
ncbi:MAG: gluconate 2-dehydrogenase subunit 3 family protein [Gemmatimonadota bacterium]|nr:gluconate 2-dehydrogenase subunit 3 family protein [Gemmatimonadota bacterium]MDH5760656.1 gluconate 2-dehydrogenase subunit 3 family protein [Gemmatimonadota bacterium]